MESFLSLKSLSSPQLFPNLHPSPPTFLRSQIPRHRLFIHSKSFTTFPISSSSSSSICKFQSFKQPPNICISTCKTVTFAIFIAFLSFIPIPTARRLPAFAATSLTEKTHKGGTFTDHEFSAYTRRLLSLVSALLGRIEDVKSGKGDMNGVKKALKEVKRGRRRIEGEVIGNLNAELSELRRVNVELSERLVRVVELAKAATNEMDALLGGFEMDEERKRGAEELERRIGDLEREYDDLVAKVGEIEDRMVRRETMTYSVAVRELSFVEKESELLVQRFGRRIMEVSRRVRYGLLRNNTMLLFVQKVLDMIISSVLSFIWYLSLPREECRDLH